MRWVLILSGIVFISIINGELNNIAFLFVFSEIILFLFLVIKCNPYWTKPNWEWIRLHLSFGVKNIMAEFVSTLNTHFPILIIGYLSGNSAAGYFAYILFFARSILFIPGALQKNFNPVFTKYWYSGQLGEIKKRLYKVFKGCIISIIPAFLNLYVFFFIYTKYFMPTDYLDLSFILIILLVGVSTTYLFGPFSTLLIMAGELYSNLLRVALVAVTNLVLTVIFVLKFGYFGAAYAMSISLFIDVCLLDILYRRKLGIHFFHITIFQLIGIDDKNHK
jgi:O-antigen/teichoic acid export membrane protein